ncbi:MaoC family dehydratase [Pseudogracilibacillus sp. ICA-222130]|uniref:MaoC family dehydratase n=1 Tax=Pseudogracilibacillus sp. ICA-222130 TaxID=3134655 RepID=UPI0030C1054A
MRLIAIVQHLIVTENLVTTYANISGDQNKVHLCIKTAKEKGFEDRIAHGMLILAIHSTLCTPLLEKGWELTNVKSKFVHPIYIHDKLELTSTITYHSAQKCTATILCTNFHNKTTFYGKMVFVRRSKN